MNRKMKLLGALLATIFLPTTSGVVFAEYHAGSDTGIEALDYIEYNTIRSLDYMDSEYRPIIINMV